MFAKLFMPRLLLEILLHFAQHNSNMQHCQPNLKNLNLPQILLQNVQCFSIKHNKMYEIQTGKFILNFVSSEDKIVNIIRGTPFELLWQPYTNTLSNPQGHDPKHLFAFGLSVC